MNGVAQLWTAAPRAALDDLRDHAHVEYGAGVLHVTADRREATHGGNLVILFQQAMTRSYCEASPNSTRWELGELLDPKAAERWQATALFVAFGDRAHAANDVLKLRTIHRSALARLRRARL